MVMGWRLENGFIKKMRSEKCFERWMRIIKLRLDN